MFHTEFTFLGELRRLKTRRSAELPRGLVAQRSERRSPPHSPDRSERASEVGKQLYGLSVICHEISRRVEKSPEVI